MALNPYSPETRPVMDGGLIDSTSTVGQIQILRLSGNFDVTSHMPAREWLETAASKPPAFVVVNLSGVTFLDSTALSTLVLGKKRAQALNGDVRLCEIQQQVRIIFELTRLDSVFEIFLSEEEAIRSFRS
jgi:anti-sigma B factor antagonist